MITSEMDKSFKSVDHPSGTAEDMEPVGNDNTQEFTDMKNEPSADHPPMAASLGIEDFPDEPEMPVEQCPLNINRTSPFTDRKLPAYLNGYKDVLACLIACLGAVSLGLVMGYTNPALQDDDLLYVLQNNSEKQTWFGSLVTVGAIFGGPIAGYLVARTGRKATLMVCTGLMGMGWFLIICASDYILLYCGRIVEGISAGMISLVVPLYIAEVSSKEHRGVLGAGFQCGVNVGILLVYSLGLPLSWRWLAVACLSISTINVVLLLLVPDTPRWYIIHKRSRSAMESLAWFRGDVANLKEEYSEIEKNLASQMTGSIALRDFLKPEIYKPTLISLGLMFFQQASGINAIVFYSSEIFERAGFTDDPKMPTIIFGAVIVVAGCISCFLMDRAGRRILLLISGIFNTLSLISLGVSYYLIGKGHAENLSWLTLTSVIVFATAFFLGWGPIPWLVISEIIPVRARSVVNSMTTCLVWILAFLVTKEFSRILTLMNDFGAFWFFGAFSLLSCFFVGIFLPETKGRSLEDIQNRFSGLRRKEICLDDKVAAHQVSL